MNLPQDSVICNYPYYFSYFFQKVVDYPVNDPIVNEDSMEFYGQRPWRPGNQNLEPPDPQKEKDGTQALQHREITSVNHSVSGHRLILRNLIAVLLIVVGWHPLRGHMTCKFIIFRKRL